MQTDGRPTAGRMVVLKSVPPGLLQGLPETDRIAIAEQQGHEVQLVGYDEDGRAELEFTDQAGIVHSIWVDPVCIEQEG